MLLGSLLWALLGSCAPAGARSPAHLAARLFQAQGIEVLAAEELSAATRVECERLAERWSLGRNQARKAFPTRLLAAGDAGSRRVPRVVVGRPDSPELASLLEALGVELGEEGGFRYLERGFIARHTLVATFQDPRRPGWPVTIVVGSEPHLLAQRLRLLEPTGWPGARAFRDGEPMFELRLGLDGRPQRATLVDRGAARREALRRSRGLPHPPEGLDVWVDPDVDPERVARIAAVSARAHERARALVGDAAQPGSPAEGELFRLFLVGRAATLLGIHGRVELSIVHYGSLAATALVAPGLADDGGAGVARATLLAGLGPPAEEWLEEAAAIELADTWWGRPLEEWGAHLVDAALLPGAAAATDPTADQRSSPHVLLPARALLVRFLRRQVGDEGLRAWWQGGFGSGLEPAERAVRRAALLDGFELWLGALLQPHLADARGRRDAARESFQPERFRRGVALDSLPMPGGAVVTGDLAASLDQARALGADALSQIAYFLEHPPETRYAGLLAPPRVEPIEGDATLGAVLGLAREQGLGTLLRPVLLLSDAGSYSGWTKRTRLAEWARHFAAREVAVLHAALLAELCQVELLSIGENEGDASLTSPDAERPQLEELLAFKRARWRATIDTARRAYSGGLTYLATLPFEAEGFEMWDRLDVLGVFFTPRMHAPTGEGPDAARIEAEMLLQLRSVAELGQRVGRPVLIGEVAFRSTREAWREPELGFGPLDLEQQARLFEAFRTALARLRSRSSASFAGYYVWGWGTDPSRGGAADRGFSPQNKPAAATLFH